MRCIGRSALIGVCCTLLGGATAQAQQPQAEASFSADEWLTPGSPISIQLSHSLEPGTGTLALFVGGLDVTALADVSATGVRYRPSVVPLPSGRSDVFVYHVDPNGEWNRLGQFTLRVLTQRGFRESHADPRLDLANEGQVAEGRSPDEPAFGRSTWQYGSLNGGVETRHARGDVMLRTRVNAVGVTERERALRFGERQERAPRLDLADYVMTVEAPSATLTAGNIAFGSSRHLINSYSTRGLRVATQLGARTQLGLAAMAGRSIVGWQRILGVGEAGSRILSAALGVEALPDRPGLLRLEGTVMDGEVPSRTGFTQGGITDVETNRGAAVRVLASDPARRVTLDAGIARSRFHNPPDQLLSRGLDLVMLHPVTSSARYLDADVHLLRGTPLIAGAPTSLMIGIRHERVDPLYRSVASYSAADVQRNAVEAAAAVGMVTLQFAHGRARDNLDAVESILETHTRDSRAGVSVPLAALVRRGPAWLPQASYSFARVHQFGGDPPPNSGFQPGHVPDQVSDTHGAQLGWQLGRIALAYQVDYSHQDNRQPGRENADFRVLNHSTSMSVTAMHRLSLNLDAAIERASAQESGEVVRGRRGGVGADVRVTSTTGLSFQASHARTREQLTDVTQDATTAQAQLSQRVTLMRRRGGATQGQVFMRFAGTRMNATSFDNTPFKRNSWTVNTGANLSVF